MVVLVLVLTKRPSALFVMDAESVGISSFNVLRLLTSPEDVDAVEVEDAGVDVVEDAVILEKIAIKTRQRPQYW